MTVSKSPRPTARASIALAALAALGLGACGSDAKSSPTTQPVAAVTTQAVSTTAPATTAPTASTAASGGAKVTIANFAFNIPSGVTAGEPITVTNNDTFTHTFSDAAGSFTVKVSAGASGTVTIAKAGTYQVVCQIHSKMKGTIVVN